MVKELKVAEHIQQTFFTRQHNGRKEAEITNNNRNKLFIYDLARFDNNASQGMSQLSVQRELCGLRNYYSNRSQLRIILKWLQELAESHISHACCLVVKVIKIEILP